jgi:glutathione S-transferase
MEEGRLDFRQDENLRPEYLALNPTGRVPTLVDGNVTVWESGACLQYLAERYGEGKLAPDKNSSERAAYLTWMYFAASSLDPVCFELVRPDLPKEEKTPRMERAREELPRLLQALLTPLKDRMTLLQSGFSTADILVGSCLHYANGDGQMEAFPILTSYLKSLQKRPAAKAAGLFLS